MTTQTRSTPLPSMPARLRERLSRAPERGPLLLPGAYDALSSVLAEQAGFEAVYMTGFGATASLLGLPDVGLLSGGEMADQARRLTAAIDVPLVADADTGYGNAINVAHTVRLYEQAGVAAIQLEDQLSPKKCGHMSDKHLISRQEMVGKVRAAADARRDPDLVILARTDAIAVDGVDEAISRGRAYRKAGADALFIEAPTTEAELARVATELAGETPLVLNWVEGGRTPMISYQRIHELGFAAVLFPISALLAATGAVRAVLADILAHGTPSASEPERLTFDQITDIVGLPHVKEMEQRYAEDAN